jgi:hypothetical protein
LREREELVAIVKGALQESAFELVSEKERESRVASKCGERRR